MPTGLPDWTKDYVPCGMPYLPASLVTGPRVKYEHASCGSALTLYAPSGPDGSLVKVDLEELKPGDTIKINRIASGIEPGAFIDSPALLTPSLREGEPAHDVCPACKAGVLKGGIATLPNECCAIYFFGRRSPAHDMWTMTKGVKGRVYDVRAATMSWDRTAPEEDEAALRKRLTGLGRDALIEEIIATRAELRKEIEKPCPDCRLKGPR